MAQGVDSEYIGVYPEYVFYRPRLTRAEDDFFAGGRVSDQVDRSETRCAGRHSRRISGNRNLGVGDSDQRALSAFREADAARRWPRSSLRPELIAHPRLDWRTLESRAVAVAVRNRWRRR